MGKVIEFPNHSDTLEYVYSDDEVIIGVSDAGAGVEVVCVPGSKVFINVLSGASTAFSEKENLKDLMIAWLALNYPDVIKWDED